MKDHDSLGKKWASIVRRIWDDPNLKEELLKDPRAFLEANEVVIPKSQTVEIHENKEGTLHLILPEKPPRDIPDEILSYIVAGN